MRHLFQTARIVVAAAAVGIVVSVGALTRNASPAGAAGGEPGDARGVVAGPPVQEAQQGASAAPGQGSRVSTSTGRLIRVLPGLLRVEQDPRAVRIDAPATYGIGTGQTGCQPHTSDTVRISVDSSVPSARGLRVHITVQYVDVSRVDVPSSIERVAPSPSAVLSSPYQADLDTTSATYNILYPPIDQWPVQENGTKEIHVDVNAEARGEGGTTLVGSGTGWDVYCIGNPTPTPPGTSTPTGTSTVTPTGTVIPTRTPTGVVPSPSSTPPSGTATPSPSASPTPSGTPPTATATPTSPPSPGNTPTPTPTNTPPSAPPTNGGNGPGAPPPAVPTIVLGAQAAAPTVTPTPTVRPRPTIILAAAVERPRALPKTGGVPSEALLALLTGGALLAGAGALVRRRVRS